jgi:hypothetical protein
LPSARGLRGPTFHCLLGLLAVAGLRISEARNLPLRANIDETVLPAVITEQGENRNQCEEQRNSFDFPHDFACR